MITDIAKCKNDYSSYYLQLSPDWIKEFKKEKPIKEEKSFPEEWWKNIFENKFVEREFHFVSKFETNRTHYENELEKYNRAKELFQENLPELLEKHRGKYACAIEGRIEIGDNKEELLKKVIKKIGFISMYIAKIGDEKRTIRYKVSPKRIAK